MTGADPMRWIVKYGQIIKSACEGFLEDGGFAVGAALSFYTAFSLSPLLLVVMAITGMLGSREALSQELISQMRTLTGEAGGEIAATVLKSANRPDQGFMAMIVGVATLLFGATGAFVQLQTALNAVWKVRARPGGNLIGFLRRHLLSLGMVFVIGFLLLVSLLLSTGLAVVAEHFADRLPGLTRYGHTLHLMSTMVVITALFGLMFKVLPDVRVAWRDVGVGAVVTGVLMTIGQVVIGWYIGYTGIGSAYGAAGSLIVVLVWIYYSALIVFLGAELTQVYAHQRGAPLIPRRHAEVIPHARGVAPALNPAANLAN